MKINKYIITMIRFNISDFVVVGCYDARPIGSLSSFTQTKHRIVVVFVFSSYSPNYFYKISNSLIRKLNFAE